ncbi:MAG: hypothetical protein P4M09_04915 [Devosia sp.]|nr:hypothetical protein [Devosia sp.]
MPQKRRLALALGVVLVLTSAAGGASAATAAPIPDEESTATAISIVVAAFPNADVRQIGPDAEIRILTSNGRAQTVFLGGRTFGPASSPLRIINSSAVTLTGPVDPTLAIRLLSENSSGLPYGYWALSKVTTDGKRTLVYEVEVRADPPAAAVQAIIVNVAKTADAMEAELTGKDVF